ncbi:MAG: Eco57I restriction-modification methylase domain-containing protein [Gammaproteobacteria bacterium]|nr:Eco57I restriction-modification methylase domain-containing protein [Gammaproteobacteria bacterium]
MRDLRPTDAEGILAELARHPSERYFILKSIVLNNLYGVDIMKEATEICKLRLFLKLAAQLGSPEQIEPLPDIDFNIRPGNALVGFSSVKDIREAPQRNLVDQMALHDIDPRSERADTAFARFRRLQTETGADAAAIHDAKRDVRRRTKELRDELDRYLAFDYGVSPDKPRRFGAWRASHQPFHWCAEFFGIVEGRGGFDVVIGNPPYIPMGKVRKRYSLSSDFTTASCPDVYAAVVERSVTLMQRAGRVGMIVPLNITFSKRYAPVRHVLKQRCPTAWFSSFGRIPSALFSFKVRVRNSIILAHGGARGRAFGPRKTFTTRLHRWFEEERPVLFGRLSYAEYDAEAFGGLVPKTGSPRILRTLETLRRRTYRFGHEVLSSPSPHVLYFKKSAYNWITFCVDQPPVVGPDGEFLPQTEYGRVGFFADADTRDLAMALLNGRLCFLWWIAVGDDFHLTKADYETAPFGPAQLQSGHRNEVGRIVARLKEAMTGNVTYKKNAGKLIGNYNLARCRDISDRSDKILLDALGLRGLWDEIELEYSLVVRTEFDSGMAS